jgi:hypothetical protein
VIETELTPLHWRWITENKAEAWDGGIRYFVGRRKNGRWHVKMNGSIIGKRDGFWSFESAVEYINYGGPD